MGRAITPPNSAWIDFGGYVDDEGNRIAAIGFSEPGDDPDAERVTIRFEPAFFEAFALQAVRAAQSMKSEEFWIDAEALAEKDRRHPR